MSERPESSNHTNSKTSTINRARTTVRIFTSGRLPGGGVGTRPPGSRTMLRALRALARTRSRTHYTPAHEPVTVLPAYPAGTAPDYGEVAVRARLIELGVGL